MRKNTLVDRLPFSKDREINTLVENRRSFTLDDLELNIFETYKSASLVPLRFDDLVLINMIQGKKVMHLNNVHAFEYLPGQTMVLPPATEMRIDFPEATWQAPTQCTALAIEGAKIKSVLDYLNEFYPKHQLIDEWKLDPRFFHMYNSPEIVEVLNRLFHVITDSNPLKNVLVDISFKELIVKLLQAQSLLALEIGKSTNTVLLYLKDFIKKNITEKLSIDMLLKVSNMSKASLTRMFKRELGVSPMEYVIEQRISRAKQLLLSSQSVKEACFAAGFTDVNYFVRLFKNREGITPGAFILK